jgi:hypothetical protein
MTPQQIIEGMIARGIPPAAAIGFAGNFAVESRFDPGINEIAPLVPGSRGGFGFAQWTGPRRRELEAFAQARGVPVSDADMQLDFLMQELNTTEIRARDAIFSAQDPAEAARLVSERFLRPGIPHLDRSIEEATRLAGGNYGNYGSSSRQQPPQQGNALAMIPPGMPQPQNALTPPPPPPQLHFEIGAIAPSAFMRRPTGNALTSYGFAPGQSPFIPG